MMKNYMYLLSVIGLPELVTAPHTLVAELDDQLAWESPELTDEVVPTPPVMELRVKYPVICPGPLAVGEAGLMCVLSAGH